MSGLNTTFPNGYVIQCISASGDTGTKLTSGSRVTDGATFTNSFQISSVQNNFGLVGLMVPTPTLTSDSITLSPSGTTPSLSGFIITDKPVVSQGPVSTTNNAGSPFVLSSTAIGIQPLSYQWQLNGVNLTGATSASYTNANAAPTDGGIYSVIVSNPYGSATNSAIIAINQKATITFDLPASVTNYTSMNAAFSVVAGGQAPLTYLWTRNGVPIANPTNTVSFTNLQVSDAASYQVVVTNIFGSVTSSVASLVVVPAQPPYDGFAYSSGDLTGQNGGSGGWSGAWYEEAGFNGSQSVFTPATPWRGGISQLTSTGGALLLAGIGAADYDDTRNLTMPIGGNGYGTIYISFVAQVTNTTWGGLELVNGANTSLFIGCCFNGRNWGWGTRGAPDAVSTISPNTYSLLVYRFDYTPTNTAIRLYVNPSSLSAEPVVADVTGSEAKQIAFDKLRIISHGFYGSGVGPDGLFDELRIGGTWASVTPHTLRNDAAFAVQIIPGGVVKDTKPVGAPYNGANYGTTWLASSTGTNFITLEPGTTRLGVEQFIQTNNTQITIAPNADFNNATNGTICFWMQYALPLDTQTFPGPGTEAAMLFDRRSNPTNSSGTVITVTTSGKIMFQSTGGARFTGNGTVVDGLWHHIAVTYGQATNDVVSIYIDGALDASLANPRNWSWPTNLQVELGRSHDSYWYIYNGQMDDFRMYNRVLTPAEISLIGTPATSDTLVDTSALNVRFNFDASTASYGDSLVWPYGVLQSSLALGAAAVWTSLTNAVSPQPFTPSAPSRFFRLIGTP